MAFTENQKNEHTSELQHHLYVISRNDKRILPVIPDGSYTDDTKGAVTAFQRVYGLETTGEVDRETWEKIAEEFRRYNLKPVKLDIFPEDFVLLPGSHGDLVYIIQIMLNILSREYGNLSEIAIDGVYSPKMNEAVISFKEIGNTDKNIEGIGTETWNLLTNKINSRDFSRLITTT